MISVLILADSAIGRSGLETIVQSSPRLRIAGSVLVQPSLSAWVEPIERVEAEVLLLAAALPDELALLTPEVDEATDLPVIVWLADDIQSVVLPEALQLGIRAILPTDASAEEIVAAIETVAQGLLVLHPEVIGSLTALTSPRPLTAARQALTPREIEVLQMLSEGMGNKSIARQLYISEHTVKFHISSIFSKLNVSSRTEAVTLGIRQGLILL